MFKDLWRNKRAGHFGLLYYQLLAAKPIVEVEILHSDPQSEL